MKESGSNKPDCAIYVDMGTTNTRVWLARGAKVLSRENAAVGVRNTARESSTATIRAALRDLIRAVRQTPQRDRDCVPLRIVAAGMITSAQGLAEVPHVPAPAGLEEIARNAKNCSFSDVTELPVLLVPGVRSGPLRCDRDTASQCDVMRGEEALCLGLVAQKRVRGAATVLSLGSHWKTIQLDEQARIAGTVTSMSGELIQAAQTETILASAVPHRRAAALDRGWAEAGMGEQRRSGLSRALFCVRLLEQRSESTAEERLAFMVGAFIGADLDAMTASGMLRADRPLFIAGTLAETWRLALGKNWSAAVVLSDQEAESAFLAGLRAVAAACSVG